MMKNFALAVLGFSFCFVAVVAIFLFFVLPSKSDYVQQCAVTVRSHDGTGSGAIIEWHNHTVIITAAHCVENATLKCYYGNYQVDCSVGWVGDAEKPELPDLAILIPLSPIKVKGILIRDVIPNIWRDEDVITAGAPERQRGMFSRGYINAADSFWRDRHYVIINADCALGSSGSVVYTRNLELVGVVVRQNSDTTRAGFLLEPTAAVLNALKAWEDK